MAGHNVLAEMTMLARMQSGSPQWQAQRALILAHLAEDNAEPVYIPDQRVVAGRSDARRAR